MEETTMDTATDEVVGATESDDTSEDIAHDSQESGQADNGQPELGQQEDPFFDPSNLPAELLPAYKSMQADYTKKTQGLSQERKAWEAERAQLMEKARQYDKYAEYAPVLDEMLSRGKQGQQQSNPKLQALEQQLKERGYSDEAIDLMKMGAEFTLNTMYQTRVEEQAMQKLEQGIEQANQLDPRLNDETVAYQVDGENVSFGQMVADFVASDPNWKSDPVAATRKAIKKVDALIQAAKSEGKAELSNAAKAKSQKYPGVTTSPQSAIGGNAPKSIHEAARMAEEELGY